jgi:hypothetical protein
MVSATTCAFARARRKDLMNYAHAPASYNGLASGSKSKININVTILKVYSRPP